MFKKHSCHSYLSIYILFWSLYNSFYFYNNYLVIPRLYLTKCVILHENVFCERSRFENCCLKLTFKIKPTFYIWILVLSLFLVDFTEHLIKTRNLQLGKWQTS